jgi:hypothetical protein
MKQFLLYLLVSANCYAGIGTITEQVNKPPQIERAKQSLTGSKGTGVEMNDVVNTMAGKVKITFEDDTKVEITENSKLIIDDFVYDSKSSKGGKLAVKIALGTVRYASGQIAKNNPQAVAINTPTATVAVRGTDFTSTVDELGESMFILLPSCPQGWTDIDKDCKTGKIEVINDAGSVLLDKPFQGTKVSSRNIAPMKPTILNLTPDTINNLLILSPPKELKVDKYDSKNATIHDAGNMLAVNYLQQDFLKNEMQSEQQIWGDNPLVEPLLQQYFLENIFNILSEELKAESQQLLANVLAPQSTLLPDYKKETGVVATIGVSGVTLTRNDSSNIESVTVPKSQQTTIIEQQGAVSVKNRVISSGTTLITLKQ